MPAVRRFAVSALACLALSLASAPAARADIITLVANITHDQETVRGTFLTSAGAPRPPSFGTAVFTLDTSLLTLTFTATINNIDVTGAQTPNDANDNLVAAHIHAPALPGSNAGVVWGFFGAPDNDNNPDNLVVTPLATGVGGTFSSVWNNPEGNNGTTLSAQLNNILAGLAYINFHTVQFGGGEIRGQIVVPVPEPATLLLLGTSLAGAVIKARRGRRA